MIRFKKHPQKTQVIAREAMRSQKANQAQLRSNRSDSLFECSQRVCAWRLLFKNEMPILPN